MVLSVFCSQARWRRARPRRIRGQGIGRWGWSWTPCPCLSPRCIPLRDGTGVEVNSGDRRGNIQSNPTPTIRLEHVGHRRESTEMAVAAVPEMRDQYKNETTQDPHKAALRADATAVEKENHPHNK